MIESISDQQSLASLVTPRSRDPARTPDAAAKPGQKIKSDSSYCFSVIVCCSDFRFCIHCTVFVKIEKSVIAFSRLAIVSFTAQVRDRISRQCYISFN